MVITMEAKEARERMQSQGVRDMLATLALTNPRAQEASGMLGTLAQAFEPLPDTALVLFEVLPGAAFSGVVSIRIADGAPVQELARF